MAVPPQFEDFYSVQEAKKYLEPNALGYYNVNDVNKTAYDIASLRYQNEWNEYQAEQAWQRDQEAIRMQNEYNSPRNQLARYMDAGLNPSMIYGQVSPGLQSSAAKYDAPKSATPNNSVPSGSDKLARVMNVLGMVSTIMKTGADVASSIEGVKNQNLQNQILQAQLPSAQMQNRYLAQLFAERGNWLDQYKPKIDDQGNFVFDPDFLNVLFPDVYRGRLSGSKAEYQDWWNEKIAPSYESWMSGRGDTAESEAAIREYNRQMLDSMPPAVRPYWAMAFQLLEAIFGAKRAFGK